MSLPPNHVAAPPMPIVLTQLQRETLDRVSDWFLPAVSGFPTIAEADPDGHVLALALEQLRPLGDDLLAALDAVGDADIDQHMSDLEAAGAPEFEYLRTFVIGRYFTSEPVWKILGYAGRKAIPIRIGEAQEYLSGGLLDATIARGKVYRDTPDVAN